jgi:hypothetical protein
MVLDVGATAQELMELAATQRQITVEEIRERIAHSPDTPHPKQQKRHIVTV